MTARTTAATASRMSTARRSACDAATDGRGSDETPKTVCLTGAPAFPFSACSPASAPKAGRAATTAASNTSADATGTTMATATCTSGVA